MGSEPTNTYDPRHPHERNGLSIPPQIDPDGRCLVCGWAVKLQAEARAIAEAQVADLRRLALDAIEAWHSDSFGRTERAMIALSEAALAAAPASSRFLDLDALQQAAQSVLDHSFDWTGTGWPKAWVHLEGRTQAVLVNDESSDAVRHLSRLLKEDRREPGEPR